MIFRTKEKKRKKNGVRAGWLGISKHLAVKIELRTLQTDNPIRHAQCVQFVCLLKEASRDLGILIIFTQRRANTAQTHSYALNQ